VAVLGVRDREEFRCFIFPWAEGGDLRELWKRKDKFPRIQELEQVFGLIDAVRALHHGNIRHGDIKPQNMLHFSHAAGYGGFGTLVLADIGVSKYYQRIYRTRVQT